MSIQLDVPLADLPGYRPFALHTRSAKSDFRKVEIEFQCQKFIGSINEFDVHAMHARARKRKHSVD